MTIEEYTHSILQVVIATHGLEEDRTHVSRHLRYLYKQALYGYEEFGKKYASEKATNVYRSLGFSGELIQWQGSHQYKFDSKGKRNGVFHLDHVYTLSMFDRALRKIPVHQLTVEPINKLVRDNYAVAWILSDENKRLDDGGYKSKRGETLEDAIQAYSQVGIKLVGVAP